MGDAKPLILISDDTDTDRELVSRYLSSQFSLQCAEDYESTRTILSSRHVYLALVDLFLDKNDQMPMGFQIQDEFPHVPIVLMSGQNPDRVERALHQRKQSPYRLLSKDRDLHDRPSSQITLDECLRQHYNVDLKFEFKKNSMGWESIASKFAAGDHELREQLTLEANHLAQKAFLGWDVSNSDHVRATRIDIVDELESGSHSFVLLLRPFTACDEPQADVIFKISFSPNLSSEHSKFNEFKNLVGGYGLRERRYARTCHLHGQVYAVPYFNFEETRTYAHLYTSLAGTEGDSNTLGELTDYLFDQTLRPLNRMYRTSQQGTIVLSEYYAGRINLPKRAENIKRDLNAERALPHMRIAQGTLLVQVKEGVREFPHPAQRVLIDRNYMHMDEKVPAAIRHGDFHASNVLVDERRMMCWYIDYERFDVEHYTLVDHAEFEGSILFNLMDIGEMSADFLVRFFEAISKPTVNQFDDVLAAEANAKDKTEAGKALAAIRPIRDSVYEVNGMDSSRSYYHALVYEALRVAGRVEVHSRHRWHCLLAAAVFLQRVEQS